MTVGVSHTFSGHVVVVDMDTGRRWDLTPEQALAGAARCEKAITGDVVYAGIEVVECQDGRSFRFAGSADDFATMPGDLRKHAEAATQRRTVAND